MNGLVRGLAIAGISLGALVAASGCGLTTAGHLTAAPVKPASHASSTPGQPTHTSPAVSQPVAPSPAAPAAAPSAPVTASYQGPHFSTPEAAMTYLAAAFNSGNTAALHAVTTPDSYLQLTQMWTGPVNLQLQSCTIEASRGDYLCNFSHDYPAGTHETGQAVATMLIAPALNPGWYLYTIVECG